MNMNLFENLLKKRKTLCCIAVLSVIQVAPVYSADEVTPIAESTIGDSLTEQGDEVLPENTQVADAAATTEQRPAQPEEHHDGYRVLSEEEISELSAKIPGMVTQVGTISIKSAPAKSEATPLPLKKNTLMRSAGMRGTTSDPGLDAVADDSENASHYLTVSQTEANGETVWKLVPATWSDGQATWNLGSTESLPFVAEVNTENGLVLTPNPSFSIGSKTLYHLYIPPTVQLAGSMADWNVENVLCDIVMYSDGTDYVKPGKIAVPAGGVVPDGAVYQLDGGEYICAVSGKTVPVYGCYNAVPIITCKTLGEQPYKGPILTAKQTEGNSRLLGVDNSGSIVQLEKYINTEGNTDYVKNMIQDWIAYKVSYVCPVGKMPYGMVRLRNDYDSGRRLTPDDDGVRYDDVRYLFRNNLSAVRLDLRGLRLCGANGESDVTGCIPYCTKDWHKVKDGTNSNFDSKTIPLAWMFWGAKNVATLKIPNDPSLFPGISSELICCDCTAAPFGLTSKSSGSSKTWYTMIGQNYTVYPSHTVNGVTVERHDRHCSFAEVMEACGLPNGRRTIHAYGHELEITNGTDNVPWRLLYRLELTIRDFTEPATNAIKNAIYAISPDAGGRCFILSQKSKEWRYYDNEGDEFNYGWGNTLYSNLLQYEGRQSDAELQTSRLVETKAADGSDVKNAYSVYDDHDNASAGARVGDVVYVGVPYSSSANGSLEFPYSGTICGNLVNRNANTGRTVTPYTDVMLGETNKGTNITLSGNNTCLRQGVSLAEDATLTCRSSVSIPGNVDGSHSAFTAKRGSKLILDDGTTTEETTPNTLIETQSSGDSADNVAGPKTAPETTKFEILHNVTFEETATLTATNNPVEIAAGVTVTFGATASS